MSYYITIVSCGGDGTINEVANGLATVGSMTSVAVFPTGTVNDFGSFLKIPTEPKALCQRIVEGRTLDVDLGRIGENFFVNVAACGQFARVAHEADKSSKAVFGRLAYFLQGAKNLATESVQFFSVRVESAELTVNEEMFLVIIANTSSVGGFANLAPDASVTDGKLDVICVRKTTLPNLLNVLLGVLSGVHIDNDAVYYFRTDSVTLDSHERVELDFDGEDGGFLPTTVSVAKEKLRVIV